MFTKPWKCCPSVTPTSFIIHAIGFTWYCHGIYHDRYYYILPPFDKYGGRFQYLTYLTAYLIWISTGFATLVDFIQLTTNMLESKDCMKEKSDSLLISIRDELMSFWVFTMGLFVPIMFWGIAAVDLKGIYPDEINNIAPLWGWFNHFVHTFSIFYVIFLTLIVNYQHPSMLRILTNVIVLGSGYITWMWYCSQINGSWAYDFMESQSQTEFVIFIVFCHIVFFAIYLIGRKMATSKWTEEKRNGYMKDKNL